MKLERQARGSATRQGDAAQALRDLIRAEMAHERAAADGSRAAAELAERVDEAREHYRRQVAAPVAAGRS